MPDSTSCPLCGGDNACAMQGADSQAGCWCQDAKFTNALLARLPEAARNQVCICARCAASGDARGTAAAAANAVSGESETVAQAR